MDDVTAHSHGGECGIDAPLVMGAVLRGSFVCDGALNFLQVRRGFCPLQLLVLGLNVGLAGHCAGWRVVGGGCGGGGLLILLVVGRLVAPTK